jgi:hypothetical protein
MVAFLLLLYMGSAPEDRLRAATVVLVFFICPRLFLFDPRPVSLSAPGFITVFSVPVFLPHCTLDSSPRAWFRAEPARDRIAGAAETHAAATFIRRDSAFRCRVQHCIDSPRSSMVAPGLPRATTVSACFSFFSFSFFSPRRSLRPICARAGRRRPPL